MMTCMNLEYTIYIDKNILTIFANRLLHVTGNTKITIRLRGTDSWCTQFRIQVIGRKDTDVS